MGNVISFLDHPVYKKYLDKRAKESILAYVEHKRNNPKELFTFQVFEAQIIYMNLYLDSRALKTIKPVSYVRLADPWEKATRMICGVGYVDEFM